ncbi:hypothetical protein GDO86_001091 [Hymenochirus boettgeri]|uniref:Uncharacterized protein n=1 Tax=Hymenochirus boettgeri TaxID=247094 RepID=A0A8T2KH64_9PIPI|nr:hypothetical protein GDO86_001091 [Hymenochirus boettgeri]
MLPFYRFTAVRYHVQTYAPFIAIAIDCMEICLIWQYKYTDQGQGLWLFLLMPRSGVSILAVFSFLMLKFLIQYKFLYNINTILQPSNIVH